MRKPSTASLRLALWQEISNAQQSAVRQLQISGAQVEFSGTIENAIALCEADQSGNIAGLAIICDDQIIGFLLLKKSAAAPDWTPPGAAIISALRIDMSQQGRGLGTAALCALPEWVAQYWSHISALVLSVDEDNVAGIRAYQKAGFRDLGQRVPGRIGYVRYMFRAMGPENE
jgi:ribosomal protein S18 acetylase RimI-like enzyme